MEAPLKKNEPTWLEMGIAYAFWAFLFLTIYSMGLKPRGYTISKAVTWLKGDSSAKSIGAKKPDKSAKKVAVPEMAPEKTSDMAPEKAMAPVKNNVTPTMTVRPMKKEILSEEDD
ncbi:hypothetical protein KKF84_09660 [Myxococcota bacterium]|nr:hypothetical protein [Myxococcota bacterium]MBU1535577.1 hypothetical protein [Myxococcota bacterium]